MEYDVVLGCRYCCNSIRCYDVDRRGIWHEKRVITRNDNHAKNYSGHRITYVSEYSRNRAVTQAIIMNKTKNNTK